MARDRKKVALLPSESLRPRMAGIGLRYMELAHRLPDIGFDVVLLQPGDLGDVPSSVSASAEVRPFERGRLAELVEDCDVAVSQGQLANDLLVEVPHLPTAVDLYDPFLVENLSYSDSLGLDPWRNDHATWVLQMSRGDFFLCSCEEQRQYYLGFLTALGRINPRRIAADPDARGLIDLVPFGVPEALPEHRPYLDQVLPKRRTGERRLLFGGLYDWYDPWPVFEALAAHDSGDPWTLLVIRNPNPGTPQELFERAERWCRARGLWHEGDAPAEGPAQVRVLDWVPVERRFDLLRDVDLMVATHRPTLESRLSLRTRFLDALAAGCPVIATEGGGMSRLLAETGAGLVVPPGDAPAVAGALHDVLNGSDSALRRGALELVARFSWRHVLEPLATFCRRPVQDRWKEDFAFRPDTLAPTDDTGFRLRRRLRGALATLRGQNA
ncbi:MAG: glycosyltransferase family 4 protein [Thermoanaerobaculia bacterium]|nr:glycosyltransferase family 4 protein [Thermoanaerobaculia bacterium]